MMNKLATIVALFAVLAGYSGLAQAKGAAGSGGPNTTVSVPVPLPILSSGASK
jgi:hypothetical protein